MSLNQRTCASRYVGAASDLRGQRDIPVELLSRLICYDASSGHLTFAERSAELFPLGVRPQEVQARIWNGRFAGKPAFATNNGDGYLCGALFQRSYRAHRVAWAISTGAWPVGEIDHINHDRQDNRLENLREVCLQENSKNRGLYRNNKSGCLGVVWHKTKNLWVVQIGGGSRRISVGGFSNLEDAILARRMAERENGYHVNHGGSA